MSTEEVVPTQTNPLLAALRIPGETFRLPSQGLFYKEGVLDDSVRNGEVEVYPMTAIDEIIISTPDKLLSGRALMEVFAHCVPQIKNSTELLAKDVDFLMVCLRMVSFGQFMNVVYTHNCEHGRENTYSVDLQDMIRRTRSMDPTSVKQEYKCVLSSGQIATLKPMTYGDIIALYQNTMVVKTNETEDASEAEKMVIDAIVSIIQDVDGISDKKLLTEWARHISLGDKKKIQEAIQSVSEWGVDLRSNQVCFDCGEPVELRISANPVNFFI